MGGVPALLMVAALGVTYGWQPDGREGVEYIIQIPADQVDRMQRLGEISSTIDPAVRGRVSKITVRVGEGPLPRRDLPGFTRTGGSIESYVAQADHTPIPIPETGRTADAGKEAVMKPQAGVPNSGMTLPSTLANPDFTGAANRTQSPSAPPKLGAALQSELDAARKRLGNAADTAVRAGNDAVRRTEDALRGAAAGALGDSRGATGPSLQFTGNDPQGAMSRARVGVPTTEPTSPSARAWPELKGSSAAQSRNQTRVPRASTDPIGAEQRNPFRIQNERNLGSNGLTVPSGAAELSNRGVGSTTPYRGETTGLRPGDQLGRLPSGITLPTDRSNSISSYADAARDSGTNIRTPMTQRDAFGNPLNGNTQQNVDTNRTLSQSPLLGNHSTIRRQAGADRRSASTDPTASDLVGMPPGTWTVDGYGRPIDRQGRLLDRLGRPIDPYGSTASTQVPIDQRGVDSMKSLRRTADDYRVADSSRLAAQTPSQANYPTGNRETFSRGTPSPSSDSVAVGRASQPGSTDANLTRITPQPTVQPVFSVLLLISFVANVYLVFWLKNLRDQFRDLVAAKRIASNNAPS